MIVTGGRTTVSAQNTAGDLSRRITCSQKQQQRKQQAGAAYDDRAKWVWRPTACCTSRKRTLCNSQITSTERGVIEEALGSGDEDGKKQLEEHTTEIDVQEMMDIGDESRVRTINHLSKMHQRTRVGSR